VYRHDRVYTGDNYYHYANPGYVLIDLFARIRNLGSDPLHIKWNTLQIKDDSGETQPPSFAGIRVVGHQEKVDAFSIPTDITVAYDTEFTLPAAAYVRLYYLLEDKPEQIVQFGIGEWMLIQFLFRK
jgi:hypothetical protein